jgi:ATP-dependent Clp protease ATP-binding subunit ClpA
MLEHLNANCRKVIVVAQEAARMFGQSSIETDHLLLAILHTDSSAANLLEAAGATLQVVHSLVQPTGKPAENRGLIKFSPSTKQVLFQCHHPGRLWPQPPNPTTSHSAWRLGALTHLMQDGFLVPAGCPQSRPRL